MTPQALSPTPPTCSLLRNNMTRAGPRSQNSLRAAATSDKLAVASLSAASAPCGPSVGSGCAAPVVDPGLDPGSGCASAVDPCLDPGPG